ncbi:MFS transporter [Natrialbaceae archaeon AArc-T1-2]|uniref:MFS transporter n=1 Tax=Natrialbaceae archaeon AArc-T1-2 TaxID=3053904 RepID=UPI00255AFE13|nr:MFS transporter [Natrialbaceae archaeon AArc-T1-2]WIV68287.1 MFS transporter [Natrialbaceae archaeon AArc-T1-2]
MNDNDRSIVGYVMVGHAMVHTYELSIPILMTVWLLEFSVSAAVLGASVTVGYGLFGVGSLPGGVLVDRFGPRALISACLAGMGLSFLLLSLAPGIGAITVALAVWGLAASVYHPAGLTLISNGVRQRGVGFAYHGMAGNAGIAFGPLATALLLLAFDWRLVAAILAVPALVGSVAGLLIAFDPTAAVELTDGGEDGGSDSRSLGDVVGDTRRLFTVGFLTVFVVVSFNGLYYRGTLTFLPDLLGDFLAVAVGDVQLFDPDTPMAEEFDLAQYLYVGLLTVGIVGQYVGGKLTDAIEPERGLAGMSLGLTVVALLFVPVAETGLVQLLVVSVVLGFVLFALQPFTQATIAKYSPPEARGLSFGYTYLAIFGIGALGAAITGTVLTLGSESITFVVLAGFSAMSCLLALSLVARSVSRRY